MIIALKEKLFPVPVIFRKYFHCLLLPSGTHGKALYQPESLMNHLSQLYSLLLCNGKSELVDEVQVGPL